MFRTDGKLFRRFIGIAKPFWCSEECWVAYGWLATVLVLLVGMTGINVMLSFVGARFMTAIANRDTDTFYHYIWVYAGCFACATPMLVLYFFAQDKLSLHWRAWLTKHLIERYFANSAYYHVNNDAVIDNPDERIAHDVREFTKFAVSFMLTMVGSVITLFSFAGILWSISHTLLLVVFGYAAIGTIVTLLLGRRLVGLNFAQAKFEADLRYNLVQVRNNRESIAFFQGENQEKERVLDRLQSVVSNFLKVISWQRNMGFVKTGYDYLVMLIPALFIAPMYFAHKIEFGTITQAGDAFAQILGALSLVVAQFRVFSEFLSQVDRIGELHEKLEAIEQEQKTSRAIDKETTITVVEEDTTSGAKPGLSCVKMTLYTLDGKRCLVRELDANIAFSESMLIMGPSGCGKSSVLRALAGLWSRGTGEIRRPPLKDMMFLPQKPYMPSGTLRAQIAYPSRSNRFSDLQLYLALEAVGLSKLPIDVGGLDAQLQWENVLSIGEQQRLSFARLLLHRPAFAVLDETTSALDAANEERLYQRLMASGITYLSVGHRDSLRKHHRKLLQLSTDGTWQVTDCAA